MKWSWPGIVAVILATTLGAGYAAVMVVAALHQRPIDAGALQAMTNLGGILAGALAGYLGGLAAGKNRDDDRDS
jgi:hypothetical protein